MLALGLIELNLTTVKENVFSLFFRLQHAVHLLLHSNLDITRICYDSGYGSLNNFERVFKKRYVISIFEYRRKKILKYGFIIGVLKSIALGGYTFYF
ncbi:helix-turn-helix domain-containing protein [Fredinandcohnia humi]